MQGQGAGVTPVRCADLPGPPSQLPPLFAPSHSVCPSVSCPQSQLSRCQEAQAQLQGEVGQLLDSLAATRAAHEQVRLGTGYVSLLGQST